MSRYTGRSLTIFGVRRPGAALLHRFSISEGRIKAAPVRRTPGSGPDAGVPGLDREIRLLPGIPATYQRSRLGPTSLPEFLCHTGTGSFVWSSAICDQPGILGQS